MPLTSAVVVNATTRREGTDEPRPYQRHRRSPRRREQLRLQIGRTWPNLVPMASPVQLAAVVLVLVLVLVLVVMAASSPVVERSEAAATTVAPRV